MSPPGRLIGVVFSPRAAYAEVAARPRWFGALAILCVVIAGANFIFLSTEIGQNALFDQQLRMMESFGVTITDAMYRQLEAGLGRAPYFTAISQFIVFPLMSLLIAGLLFAVFVAILGADGTFKQVYAIVVHSGMILVVQQFFIIPLNYARESMSPPSTLAVFLPMLDETTFVMRLLGAIDLFLLWWIVSLSIGVGVLFKRRTGPIAASLIGVYLVIAAIVAALRSS